MLSSDNCGLKLKLYCHKVELLGGSSYYHHVQVQNLFILPPDLSFCWIISSLPSILTLIYLLILLLRYWLYLVAGAHLGRQ